MLYHEIGNFVYASGSGRGEVCDSREKFNGRERGTKGRMKLLRARDSGELGKIVSGSATQGLWLKDRKMIASQIIGEDRSRLPGRRKVEKFKRGAK